MASNSQTEDDDHDGLKREERIVEEAKERFKLADDAFRDIRERGTEDEKFFAGDQWPEDVKRSREEDSRPILTVNKLPQFVQQITNDQRQNRPSIKVHPVDDKADVETARVYQGLIRHIEYDSNADTAYDTAFESAVKKGYGYFRVVPEYVSPLSFDQCLKIKRIADANSVLIDPHSVEPDGSDANYAFVVDRLSRDEFKTLYPKAKLSSNSEWEIGEQTTSDWVEKDSVRVAEYFYKVFEEKKLSLVQSVDPATGKIIQEAILTEDLPEVLPAGVEVVDTRTTSVPAIKWCKFNGYEILEETDWLGKYIPIVPVYGAEQFSEGKRTLKGIIRDAMDPQRMLNFWVSAETETIALAPRAPYVIAEGQIEGYENIWATANRRNHAFLPYKPTSVSGQPVGPPQRNAFQADTGAITNARMLASEDLKATTGIYDASLGARSNETSGIAIQRRNVQAQTSNFHFVDNLTRSLKHTGRILSDLIPHYYNTASTARIIGEDGEQEIVKINQVFEEHGKRRIYDLSAGKYDITVDVGPSFASKRQEAVSSMLEFIRSNPSSVQYIGDLLVKNMDWPGSQEIAERLKKVLPPNLAGDSKGGDIPPQVQAQLAQMNQIIEQLTEQLSEAQDSLDKDRYKIESDERIKMRELEAKVEIERAKLDSKESQELLRQEIDEIKAFQAYIAAEHERAEREQQQQQQVPNPAMGVPDAGGSEAGQPTGGVTPGTHMEGPELP